eukprot:14147173-Alexandrium_andersonii.AAC.1
MERCLALHLSQRNLLIVHLMEAPVAAAHESSPWCVKLIGAAVWQVRRALCKFWGGNWPCGHNSASLSNKLGKATNSCTFGAVLCEKGFVNRAHKSV